MARIDVIECRDALRGLAEVPDGSCGMLLTDPPYSSGGAFRGDRATGTSEKYQTSGAKRKPEFYGDTRDGCTVLDPFMGGGTTAVAAIQTGRHFVGFELSREYCDLANRRVRTCARGGSLDG